MKQKLIRITTVPGSLRDLLQGQLKFMSKHFEVVGVSSPSGDFLEHLAKKEQIKAYPVHMTRKITPLKDIIGVYQLYKIFKKEKPFIVHTHTPKAGTLGMLAAKLAGVPHRLHTIAGLPLLEAVGAKRHILNLVEKNTYRCATKIYPNSHGLYDIILEQKFTVKTKLKVLANGSSNGIDTLHFNPEQVAAATKLALKKTWHINADDFVFVFVGRLVKDKGINELVNAFNLLNQTHSAIKLLLIGGYEDDLDPLLPETMAAIASNTNIMSTGWVADVRPYLAISHALTFPSYREGFPNVVMQAGAMELPSIVTDINGCNEIIKNKHSGLIIPTKDVEALLKAMIYMCSHPAEAKAMGEQSRAHIVSHYERRLVWEAILEEYKSLD
ncbi:glycosyltransferase family 4 protein [Mariniflexile ostreae]|uniref:Glycosyltransferase family 4 protein n=1 Tax=Mariniflexile ostreae TaxID=1520892 RepID=A0ABV5FDT8_9FLAO